MQTSKNVKFPSKFSSLRRLMHYKKNALNTSPPFLALEKHKYMHLSKYVRLITFTFLSFFRFPPSHCVCYSETFMRYLCIYYNKIFFFITKVYACVSSTIFSMLRLFPMHCTTFIFWYSVFGFYKLNILA